MTSFADDARSPAQVICVTPVLNEAWILERFLRCASMWADRIIVADQGSDDGSRELAASFPAVKLVENDRTTYDEGARQRLLLAAAREVPGRRLIVALDADEGLTADWMSSIEWDKVRSAPEGTVFTFDWVNLLPGLDRCWIPGAQVPFAFMDDGRDHQGRAIHSARLPVEDSPVVALRQIKVLHYQYVNWARMKSKQRWYQCWEAIHSSKRPVQLYRQYHHMDAIPAEEMRAVESSWLGPYEDAGIDMRAMAGDGDHWDAEVLDWILEHGADRFRRLDVWDVNWHEAARRLGREPSPDAVCDPRGYVERKVHDWLARTQRRAGAPSVRWIQRLLIPAGW